MHTRRSRAVLVGFLLAGLASANLSAQGPFTAQIQRAIAALGFSGGVLQPSGGGTGNQFFKVSGPATSVKTFTFQNATSTVPSYIPGTSGLTATVGALANDAQGVTFSATMGSVPTATLNVWSLTTTGAGSASQIVRSLNSVLAAGYTGSSNTAAIYALNQTVGTGVNYGFDSNATGSAAALNVGIAGTGQSGTKNLGVFGSSTGVLPTTTTVPFTGGVSGIAAAFSIGTGTDDILVGIDGTTTPLEVFRAKNTGDWAYASETGDASLQVDWTATSGGGNARLLVSGGTSMAFGSSNNIPVFITVNGTNRWGFDAAGNLGVGTTPNLVYLVTTPTITSGFSTTTPSIGGKASVFAVTIAATPGVTGTVAFNGTFTNIPSCSCSNTITANLVQCVPTTTTAVLNGVWVSGDIIRCTVLGQ